MKTLDTLSAVSTEEGNLGEWMQVSVDDLQPAQGQARTVWNVRELETLADSITAQGILQPLIVRRASQNGDDGDGTVYTLVAGERRLRAAKIAGLTHVPVLLREMSDEEAMLAGLTENLQRANLSVLEEGAAFARALELPGYSIRTLGTKLGLERVNKGYIEDRVRAHRSDPDLRVMIAKRPDTLTHARVISHISDQEARKAAINATLEGASLKAIRLLAESPTASAEENAEKEQVSGRPDTSTASAIVDPEDTDLLQGNNPCVTEQVTEPATELEVAEPAKAVEAENTSTVEDAFSQEEEPQKGIPDGVVEPDAVIAVGAAVGVTENEPSESDAVCDPTPRQLVDAVKCFHQALDCAVMPTDSHDLTELRREVKKMNSSYHRVFGLLFPKK